MLSRIPFSSARSMMTTRSASVTDRFLSRPQTPYQKIRKFSEFVGKNNMTNVVFPTQSIIDGNADALNNEMNSKASPLSNSLISQLTPTLKKFTLGGKIALVTG